MTDFNRALEIIDRITENEPTNTMRLALRNMLAITNYQTPEDREYRYGFTQALYLMGKLTMAERDLLRTVKYHGEEVTA